MAEQQQQIEKPKRAKSSYMFFCDAQRPEVMEANRARNGGKVKMIELAKELSELWAKLDASAKAKYEALAAAEKSKHDAAMQEYSESRKIDGLMKRPAAAYFQFINANRERISKEHNISSVGELGKKAAELWKAMSAEEKKPYEERFAKAKAEYDAWKETDEGKEALAKQKAQKQGDKGTKEDKKEGSTGVKRGPPGGEEPSPKASRRSKEAVPKAAAAKAKAKAKAKSGSPVESGSQLSAGILEKCSKMGTAESGLSYKALLEKVLTTKGLAGVNQEQALEALRKHGGLVNKARGELLGGA